MDQVLVTIRLLFWVVPFFSSGKQKGLIMRGHSGMPQRLRLGGWMIVVVWLVLTILTTTHIVTTP